LVVNFEKRIARAFRSLVAGCSSTDLAFLINWRELLSRVYIFDDTTKSVRHPRHDLLAEDGVLWPVVWLLGRHSKKHIFNSSKVPTLRGVHEAVRDFINRVKWRWSLRESAVPDWKGSGKISKKSPPFVDRVSDELDQWTVKLKQGFMEQADRRRQILISGKNRTWSNLSKLVVFATKLLRSSDWIPVVSDKDGGFALVRRGAMANLSELLKADQYLGTPAYVLRND